MTAWIVYILEIFMKNSISPLIVAILTILFMVSCVSMQDKTLSVMEKNETEIIGTVKTEFNSFQIAHIKDKDAIKAKAYEKLLQTAKNQYGDNVDIKAIEISGGFSGFEFINIAAGLVTAFVPFFIVNSSFTSASDGTDVYYEGPSTGAKVGILLGSAALGIGLSGNTQKITATGVVVPLNQTETLDRRPTNIGTASGIETALNNATGVIMNSLEKSTILAIVNVSSTDTDLSDFIANELEFLLVNNRLTVVDRSELDRIRKEQNFQLSGEVDDSTIVSIGKFAGADKVITGSVTGTGETRRLRLRVIDIRTAQVVAVASERL
jgi:PBP1b-binding outer membrane lipoprotein LpoB